MKYVVGMACRHDSLVSYIVASAAQGYTELDIVCTVPSTEHNACLLAFRSSLLEKRIPSRFAY